MFFIWFIFNLQRKKICPVLCNNSWWTKFTCGLYKCNKVPYLGWWPSVLGANLTPLWSHVENQLPHLPQPLASPLHPNPPPFSPAYLTCDIVLLREDYIGTLRVFFVWHRTGFNYLYILYRFLGISNTFLAISFRQGTCVQCTSLDKIPITVLE